MNGKRKRYLLYFLTVILCALAFVWGSAIYTSRSEFCTTCHYMEPFYASWKASNHSEVECIECHFAPGIKNKIRGKMEGLVQLVNYVSYSYKKSKPWAEIPDESCLRSGCHETRLLTGEVEYLEGITFNHTPHLSDLRRGKQLRCTSCHSQIVQGSHMSVTKSTCFICHFKNGANESEKISSCTLCHKKELMLKASREEKISFDHSYPIEKGLECTNCHSDTVVGNGPVYRQNCFSCHWEDERLEQYENTTLIHTEHISKRKIECLNCHMEIDHRISHKEIEVAAECITCHPSHHSAMKSLVSGSGGQEAVSHPSRMFEIGLNCRGCHIFHDEDSNGKEKKTFVAKSSSCDKCHAEGYGKTLSLWDESTKNRLSELSSILESVKKSASLIRDRIKKEEVLTIMEAVEFNISIVQEGKSLHNIEYANNILSASYKMLKNVASQIGEGYELPPFKYEARDGETDCLTCHYDIKQQSPSFSGLKFSHKNHLERDRSCLDCHSDSGKHGVLSINKKNCAVCHHKESIKKECADCHTLQSKIFYGEWARRGRANVPNPMAEVIDCEECHGYAEDVMRPDGKPCIDCHEKGYDDMMTEWQEDTRESLARITAMIDHLKAAPDGKVDIEKVKSLEMKINDIKNDGSLGVHNPLVIEDVTGEIEKELLRLSKSIGITN